MNQKLVPGVVDQLIFQANMISTPYRHLIQKYNLYLNIL